ncbi:MAG TPA: SMP-30/gluconolactonase/LRE family protein [Candidatus Eremiobacteraceae bacterium]|nr:SMP-30/gluconolactonase/LRE family protein [Candidatus Eremiobacteraceae bacterium]
MLRLLATLAIASFALLLTGAGTPAPTPAATPTPTPTPTATPAPTPVGPPVGTVTAVVDPGLLPHGRNVLHGIARNPKTGDVYVGVSSSLRHWNPITGNSFSNDDSLRKITAAGTVSRVTSFPYPNGILVSPRDGMVYVATGAIHCSEAVGGMLVSTHCPGTNGVVVVDPATGDHHDYAGAGPGRADGVGTNARFTAAADIVFDPDNGNMYVTDYGNHVIRQVTPDATVTTFAGSGTAGSADGVGPAASFSGPRGIAYCAKDKSLYVADRDNNEIRRITMDGTVSTVAGTNSVGFVDGPVASARFDHPQGVACDAAGDIFVADTDNNTIRVISAGGVVSSLAGSKEMGTVNAVGSAARFANPSDLYFDPTDGSLYVIDEGANNIRKVVTGAAPG